MKIDMIGLNYGRLTILTPAENRIRPSGQTATYWNCQCSCGTIKEVMGAHLRNGKTVSCGCDCKEKASIRAIARNTSHGMSKHRVHHVWSSMLQRCQNPNHKAWKWYGGKGITVCEAWQKFERFLSDMGFPEDKMTLDRIDGKKGYQRDNCRWATMKVQQRNRGNNRVVVIGGVAKTLSEWAEISGTRADTIAFRIKSGWPESQLLFPPHKITQLTK